MDSENAIYTREILDYFDPDIVGEDVEGGFSPPILLEPAPFQAKITKVALPNIWFNRSYYSATLQSIGHLPPARYTFGLKQTITPQPFSIFGTVWEPYQVPVFAPGHDLDCIIPANTAYKAITISEIYFENKICPLLASETHSWLEDWHLLSATPHSIRKLRFVVEAIEDLGQRGYLAQLPASSVLDVEESIIQSLVDVWHSFRPKERRSHLSKSTQLVRKATDFMHASASEKIYLSDICFALGISKRALQYIFLDAYGVSPMHYLRLLRLNSVYHQLLLADPQNITVTQIATQAGFWHLGNFSVAYKNTFQESPSQTLQRAPILHY